MSLNNNNIYLQYITKSDLKEILKSEKVYSDEQSLDSFLNKSSKRVILDKINLESTNNSKENLTAKLNELKTKIDQSLLDKFNVDKSFINNFTEKQILDLLKKNLDNQNELLKIERLSKDGLVNYVGEKYILFRSVFRKYKKESKNHISKNSEYLSYFNIKDLVQFLTLNGKTTKKKTKEEIIREINNNKVDISGTIYLMIKNQIDTYNLANTATPTSIEAVWNKFYSNDKFKNISSKELDLVELVYHRLLSGYCDRVDLLEINNKYSCTKKQNTRTKKNNTVNTNTVNTNTNVNVQ